MYDNSQEITKGAGVARRAAWKSPSNIAIIKYWGKHGDQLPRNPSLSLTLSGAYTLTKVAAFPAADQPKISFKFAGQENTGFARRIEGYVQRFRERYPVLRDLDLRIDSDNSFPHSTGIASSASAMSALALCLLSISGKEPGSADFLREASDMARQGSGSACRSVFGPVAVWGKSQVVEGSSDEFAVEINGLDPVFATYCDSILIVDSQPKSVSSSAGHALMHGHPFAANRFEQAHENLAALMTAMQRGDLARFVEITESEALTLHAMMMTSTPSYILMKPGTLSILEAIRTFRESSGIPVCFTLDAGPNVHVLYPEAYTATARTWINTELTRFTSDGQIIHDRVGNGPENVVL